MADRGIPRHEFKFAAASSQRTTEPKRQSWAFAALPKNFGVSIRALAQHLNDPVVTGEASRRIENDWGGLGCWARSGCVGGADALSALRVDVHARESPAMDEDMIDLSVRRVAGGQGGRRRGVIVGPSQEVGRSSGCNRGRACTLSLTAKGGFRMLFPCRPCR